MMILIKSLSSKLNAKIYKAFVPLYFSTNTKEKPE